MLLISPIRASRHSKKRSPNELPDLKAFSEELEDQNANHREVSNAQIESSHALNSQINALYLKLNSLQVPKKSNLYFSDIRILKEDEKEALSKKVCPECQVIYKENSMRGQNIVPYLDENKKVKISI